MAELTEMTRIVRMTDDERTVVNMLSHQERKDVLVRAGQMKQRATDDRLMGEYLGRIRSGEMKPARFNEQTGRPYPTNGRTWYFRNTAEPLTDRGRVPGHEGMHVLEKPDGTLVFHGGLYLRERDEVWPDLDEDDDRAATADERNAA